jgi:cell division protein FtsW
MNKKFLWWDNPKVAVITMVFILLAVGAINIYSASYNEQVSALLKKYIFFTGFGSAIAYGLMKTNYKIFLNKRFLHICYALIFVALLILVIAETVPQLRGFLSSITISVNGATRWINLKVFQLQPSELAKLLSILLSARCLGNMLAKNIPVRLFNKDVMILLAAICFNGFLVSKQPDFGTAAIIVGLAVGLLVIAGLPLIQFLFVCAGGVVLGLCQYKDYHLNRLQVWLDPWIDPVGRGYQSVQAQLTIGSGGFKGTNWGGGTFKFFHLPEAHTDFAFAVFCQENGFLGALVLIVFFLVLGFALAKIAANTKNEKGFILVCGVTLFIVGQAAANMAMVCGVLPVIGVPLAFISYGGTSLVVNLIAIGLALSVYNDELIQEKERAIAEPQERRNDLKVVSRRWNADA